MQDNATGRVVTGFSKCVLILSAFYLFAYAVTFTLSKIVHSVYDKQLRNALRNLEENSYRSLDDLMKRHKRNWRIILIALAIILLSGIAALFFTSRVRSFP